MGAGRPNAREAAFRRFSPCGRRHAGGFGKGSVFLEHAGDFLRIVRLRQSELEKETGRLAGVVAVQRTGEPGKDAADIWIRGIATPNTATPLILVDGVERAFNDIDPEDIESLTTLKDASATAVYGVRGANGVIIIKTKPGKIGKPTISADYYESFTRFTKMVDLTDGVSYMKAANEALRNDGLATKFTDSQIQNTILGKDQYLYPNVDWLNEIFNDWGHNRRVNVNVRGGSEKVSYYASVSYFNETGMTVTDKSINTFDSKMKYSRYNFTTNLSIDVTILCFTVRDLYFTV